MNPLSLSQMERIVLRTIHRQQMFRSGDRVALGVSGGKDSTLMLYILARLQTAFRDGLNLTAFRVIDPDSPCHNQTDLDQFAQFCQHMDVPLVLITPASNHTTGDGNFNRRLPPCFRCSWRRRETLFKAAREHGIKIVALAHTAFDLAVTALMNLVVHGKMETMPPVLSFFHGEILLVRPLSWITEAQVIHLVNRLPLPPPPPPCSVIFGKTRNEMEKHLREILTKHPDATHKIIEASHRWTEEEIRSQVM